MTAQPSNEAPHPPASAEQIGQPIRPRPASSPGRLARLTVKELKETLRDRRTVFTLVLMPLLVYPLLSLALRQFLLSGSHAASQVRWSIGAESAAELGALSQMLQQGESGLPPASEEPAIEQIGTVVVPGQLEKAVQEHQIDLGVRLALRGRASRGRTTSPPLNDTKETPPPGNVEMQPVEVELIHRPGGPISEAALDYVQRRLRSLNDQYVARRLVELGDTVGLPANVRLAPVMEEESASSSLASLVPLVLILMTITGAVYPAIDVTAGERERGTLEALMSSPVPRLSLLIAKYVAVNTVALLTAVVNLLAMTATVAATGLGSEIFGKRGITADSVAIVFGLLILFAAFFSAVLLCLTSFAKSFKEAQAYLIPLMLAALGPGFISLIPGVHLGPVMSIVPLANIVLLARDVLAGEASWLWASIAILTTVLYGALALAIAARIFGSDAILYGSEGSWSDLFRPGDAPLSQATPSGALATLAVVTPLFVMSSSALALLRDAGMAVQLVASALLLIVLFVAVPWLAARWQGVVVSSGFQLRRPRWPAVIGGLILGFALAPLAYELILVSQDLGFSTITQEQLEEKQPAVEALIGQWRTLSPVLVLLALALAPAVAEEFFFRGYLLGSLRGRLPWWVAVGLIGVVFGLFHASVGGIVALERVISSAVLGMALGWVSWVSGSVLPGMLMHGINNGLLISLAYWGKGLKGWGLDAVGQRHLPAGWLLAAMGLALAGAALVWVGRRRSDRPGEST